MHTDRRPNDKRKMPALPVGTAVSIHNPASPTGQSIGYVNMVDGGGWIYVNWIPDMWVQSHLRPTQVFRITKAEFVEQYATIKGRQPSHNLLQSVKND